MVGPTPERRDSQAIAELLCTAAVMLVATASRIGATTTTAR